MKRFSGFMLLLMLVLWSSCRSDFETIETNGNLKFSKDTVFLDTVFSNLSTSTYTLKVYNTTGEDLHIPKISLENGEGSLYRLNVDGLAGKSFENMEILARDSMYIFIETTVPSQDLNQSEFLYTDKLQFKSRTHIQEIPLVTLVKDAILLFPNKDSSGFPEKIQVDINENGEPQMVPGFYLPEKHLNFSRTKPYVIYGYAAVPPGKTLNVEPGARIYFHNDGGILVSKDASIRVKGSLSNDLEKMENEVIFQGDRLQDQYSQVSGQWGTIWLKEGSNNNIFENATIKNAGVGILIEGSTSTPTPLLLKNVQIYNSAVSAIRAEEAAISAENLVINNSGNASLHLNGGNYLFQHVSIGNYWQQGYRMAPAVYLTNLVEGKATPFEAEFYNSIIFGNGNRELGFDLDESVPAQVFFSNCLIKYPEAEATVKWNDFSNSEIYKDIWLNQDPLFVAPAKNNLQLLKNSAAIDKGDPDVAQQVPQDLLGTSRTSNPDLGAYEFIDIKE